MDGNDFIAISNSVRKHVPIIESLEDHFKTFKKTLIHSYLSILSGIASDLTPFFY